MKVSTISIDLAKNVFQVMGFTHEGKTVFNKRFKPYTACRVYANAL